MYLVLNPIELHLEMFFSSELHLHYFQTIFVYQTANCYMFLLSNSNIYH